MYRPGANAIDHQLVGLPRDYVADPRTFGHVEAELLGTAPDSPAVGGAGVGLEQADQLVRRVDAVSLLAATVQHELAVRWRASGLSGAQAASRWGFSRQTWSRTITGGRWAGHVGLTALSRELAVHDHRDVPLEVLSTVLHGRATARRLTGRLRVELQGVSGRHAQMLRQLEQLAVELESQLDPARLRSRRR